MSDKIQIFQNTSNILRTKQENNEVINPAKIEEVVTSVIELLFGENHQIQEADLDSIKTKLQMQFSMDLSESTITLSDPSVERGWLNSLNDPNRSEFLYYQAFKEHLTTIGRPIKVIQENEKIVDEILDLSGDPLTEGKWQRRGLVMGNVQSGKTQNYVALINKAADLGYKTIIILGGHQNELRDQTQERVDSGFIGKDTLHDTGEQIGVGNIRDLNKFGTHEGTGLKDFNKTAARSFGFNMMGLSFPVVFVVKKNVSVLKTLQRWILENHQLNPEEGKRLDQPMLLIDDEADYASPNSKQASDDVTATNKIIRDILDLFKRNTYVGYTATPFANIFIDPKNNDEMESQNLFPKDFMIKVPVPQNYCGQDFFFTDNHIDEGAKIGPVRPLNNKDVEEHEKKLLPMQGQKKWMADNIEDLPEKLEESVRAFLVSTAVRFSRGDQKEHHTMIINISHLSDVQNKVREKIEEYILELKQTLEATQDLDSEKAKDNTIIRKIYQTYDEVYDIPEDWKTVFSQLHNVSRKIKQYSINVNSKDKLDYNAYAENGLVAVVLGGHKLSRGMTLEGLSVSYFARNSKMYDTLMQMCRWFGYRDNYQDLCKVYIPLESLSWYKHIARAINELYFDLEEMAAQSKSPKNFGLKVRSHPDSLMITSRLKMHTAVERIHSISLWGQRQRRFRWENDIDKNKKRFTITEKFLTNIDNDLNSKSHTYSDDNPSIIFSNVKHKNVIEYIQDMDMIPDDTGDDALINHIKEMSKRLPQNKFKVVLRSLRAPTKSWFHNELVKDNKEYIEDYEIIGNRIILPQRLVTARGGEIMRPGAELGEATDESWLLDPDEVNRMKTEFSRRNLKLGITKSITNRDYLRSPERAFPGLIIYPFNLIDMSPWETKKRKDRVKYELNPVADFPSIGFVLTFPIENPDLFGISPRDLSNIVKKTTYKATLNVVAQKQLKLGFYADDEDIDE